MPDINELLNIAIKETENLSQGEVFLVRDLFKGYEWNRISRSERLLLGTLFLNYVNTVRGNIQAIEKTSSGQQKYIMNKDHNYEDRPESKVKETYV
ncbi:MAG TPA: single-stranded DNA-binding protein [Clostridiaceae bacterium]|nr:single-stranded DNA-binding protein [Clostridiaceae bacterium]